MTPRTTKLRLDKYTAFMANMAMTDFVLCQRSAKEEFLNCFRLNAIDDERKKELLSKPDTFYEWLEQKQTLKQCGYIENYQASEEEIRLGFDKALLDYERAVMYYTGRRLWNNHRHAFRLHKKYFCNQLRKPYSMKIITFYDRMKLYAELLGHMHPPTHKDANNLADANWEKLIIQPDEIRDEIYDALPSDYQSYLTQISGDWQTMSEDKFVENMQAYKQLDIDK